MDPAAKPVLIYDGRCRFCVRSAEQVRTLVGDRVRYESFRDPGVLARHPQLTEAQCETGAQLVMPDGRVASGFAAVAQALATRPGLRFVAWLHSVPGLHQVIDALYRAVVRNRFRLMGEVCADDACRLHPDA